MSAVLIALLAAQLSPALTIEKAPKPALPRVDRNACPFEGCQLGKWKAREPVRIFSTWKPGRKLVGVLRKGDDVTALAGIYVTFEPNEYRVTFPMPQYGLKPGDTVLGYMNIGEGFFNAWFNGNWVEEFDGSGIAMPDGSGCRKNCTAKLVKQGRSEWWVEVRTANGTVGWTSEGSKFDGSDARADAGEPAIPRCARNDNEKRRRQTSGVSRETEDG